MRTMNDKNNKVDTYLVQLIAQIYRIDIITLQVGEHDDLQHNRTPKESHTKTRRRKSHQPREISQERSIEEHVRRTPS